MQPILPHAFLPYAYDSQVHYQRKLIYHTYSDIAETVKTLRGKSVVIILNLWLATKDPSKVARYCAEYARAGDVNANMVRYVWEYQPLMKDVRLLGSDWYPDDPDQALIEVGHFKAWKKNQNIVDLEARDYEPATAG